MPAALDGSHGDPIVTTPVCGGRAMRGVTGARARWERAEVVRW
jgi:hypothetical protein